MEGGYANHGGATGDGGELALSLAPGQYTITASYRLTSETQQFTIPAGAADFGVSFRTVEALKAIKAL